jgi:hypothetical protein
MKRSTLITLILGTALAVAPAAHAVVLSEGSGGAGTAAFVPSSTSSTNLSPAEYQALQIRGAALNQQYGNALTRLTPDEFKSVVQSGLTPDELVGAVARGETLNAQYGTSVTIRPDILGGDGGSATTGGGSSIDWTTAVPGTLVGIMLIAVASLAVTRRRGYHFGF